MSPQKLYLFPIRLSGMHRLLPGFMSGIICCTRHWGLARRIGTARTPGLA